MNHEHIKQIDRDYGTPCYLMYPERFKANVLAIRSAFEGLFGKVIVGYSFKTNYLPAITGQAKELGCLAEVVSGMEYEMALALGYDPENIIFNGPVKKSEEIAKALNLGSIVNLDSWYEVTEIISYLESNPGKDIEIGLRINIELVSEEGVSSIQNGLRQGRFGLSFDEAKRAIGLLRANNVEVCSLHGHTSSSDRSPANHAVIASTLLDLCVEGQLDNLHYFNIGGGFFGAAPKGIDVSGKPTYLDYATSVADVLLKSDWFRKVSPSIVIEPGVSVVANVFDLITKVYQVKSFAGKNFVVTDTSVFDVKPSMHSLNLPFKLLSDNQPADTIVTDVVGSTCMEKDILLKEVEMPGPEKDDYIVFSGVGAYTMVFTPTFINHIPPIVSCNSIGDINLIRRRQTIADILQPYKELV